jgi:predicted nuclease with TOPRIM domain
MSESSSLNTKLKQCEPEVQEYVKVLRAENAKLQHRIAKLEVNDLSLNNRIKALEKELKKNQPVVHFNMNLSEGKP